MSDEITRWMSLAGVFLGTLAGSAIAIHVFVSGVKVLHAQLNERIPVLTVKIDELKKRLDDSRPEVVEVRLSAAERAIEDTKSKLESLPTMVREQVTFAFALEASKGSTKKGA